VRRLLLLLLMLAFPLTASAQTGSWTLYYSETPPQVNSDGSVTLTPTVSLTGDDGGYCNVWNGMMGYDTPAVMLNGNAWATGYPAQAGGPNYGGEEIYLSNTFPDVTVQPGASADLSFAGKVEGVCWYDAGMAEEPWEP
jgi:hypothetical protein